MRDKSTTTPPRPPAAHPTIADRKRQLVREEISAVAMRLFLEHGFDQVPVEQITAEAGLSRTTFFRYFPTKEDVVLFQNERFGPQVLDSLCARPDTEHAWEAFTRAFEDALTAAGTPQVGLPVVAIVCGNPQIHARNLEKQRDWRPLFAPEVARRLALAGDEADDTRTNALTAAAFACLGVAFDAWTGSDGKHDLLELLRQAMEAVSS
ncbi:TetR family transcriptional regulator [Nocardia lijiangensis]|uniref:TetR family transcriptional regulator n=1 Tax=Nocardia lijiangensis TaxID=299618 RepID=UPI00082B0914|nr:TetR family transcriptional regulator [Nocardia lijiangensis]